MSKLFLRKINPLFKAHAKFPLFYLIPVYHSVSDQYLPHLKNIINYKNIKDFEKDLDYMVKHFEFVDWDFFKINYAKPNKRPYALLTFDDGLIEFKDNVMPILLKKGIYAINFINPAFLDNSEMMFRSKISLLIERIKDDKYKISNETFAFLDSKSNSKPELISRIKSITYNNSHKLQKLGELMNVDFAEYIKNRKIYLDKNDLNILKQKGFGIASHTWNHPNLTDLSLEEQLNNTQKSINYIKENNYLDECFAFPFTDFGIKQKFFDGIFDNNENLKLTFGSAGIKLDSFENNLQRIPMEGGISAEKEINFETNYFYFKKAFNKNKIIRV